MCGIAGIISKNKNIVNKSNLQLMANALQHRGPDGEGFYINDAIGFAHRRLSIIDLSTDAAQPFQYLHYTIVFNGEIYNYIELKKFLQQKNYIFSTNADTEVLVAAFDFWGKDCLNHFDGMFAFAIVNKKDNSVFFARDTFGEKPLYYYISEDKQNFYFASEMKAFWTIGIEKNIDNTMMLNYLTLGLVANANNVSQTFYKNVFSLPAGHCLDLNSATLHFEIYEWRTKKHLINEVSFDKANEQFSHLFGISINNRLRSDVEIGTSLSGGLDSSTVVAYIQQNQQNSLYKSNAFTASFPNFKFDETQYSKEVANHFHLNQFFTSPTENDLVSEFEKLMYHQEEPLQSASIFIQNKVYELAKKHQVTVLLDGQGADEIFGGYKKYTAWYLQELLTKNLFAYKKEKALLTTNEFLEDWNLKNVGASIFPTYTAKTLQQKALKIQTQHSSFNQDFLNIYINKESLKKPVIKGLNDFSFFNTYQFGLQELLRYADRNSMAHSREVRLPFLNKELVDFAFSLPSNFKIKDGYTKWIIRKNIESNLSKNIVWRKGKIGFEPPQKQWLNNKHIQEKIIVARKILVEQKILNNIALNKPIETKEAHESNNFDWWCLCAAEIF